MKDHLRDYVISAFRFYARNGMSCEKYRNEIIEKRESNSGMRNLTEEAAGAAEKAAIEDMEAVESILAEIRANPEKFYGLLRVIEIVYFTDAHMELHKGDIKDRIHKAEFDTHISERNIYRYLKKVRIMFAEKRGLRII